MQVFMCGLSIGFLLQVGFIYSGAFLSQIGNYYQVTKQPARILCWAPSRSAQGKLLDRVLSTWARSCDMFFFASTEANSSNLVIKFDYPTTETLWEQVSTVWKYVATHHADSFDWFIKLDDDSYFVTENFRRLVQNLNPDEYNYLGHTCYKVHKNASDPSAPFNLGSGYALSRASLKKIAPFLPNSNDSWPGNFTKKCPLERTFAEDIALSDCLHIAGIGALTWSKDAWGRENFMSKTPEDHFFMVRRNNSNSWFWRNKPKNTGSGIHCCSSRPITWHELKLARYPAHAFPLQYFLYAVNVDPTRQ